MVVDDLQVALDDERIDRLFHALADATRRDIVERAMTGEWSVSALARHYPISLTAVQKHVDVLERAGLVTKQRRGREQRVRSDLIMIARTRSVLDELERVWRGRIDRIDGLLGEADDG